MADSLVYEESINTEVSSNDFVEKQWLYVNDNNNASYSGQIVIDTTALSNCGSYINWAESFLAIPLVLQAESDATTITATNSLDYMMGLKNGFWQIIHSMAVEFNNGSIIQQTPFLNVFASFKNLTSWSLDDVNIHGSLTGFFPDTPRAWVYNPNNTAGSLTNLLNTSGQGLCANRNAPFVTLTPISSWSGTFVCASGAGSAANDVTAIATTQGQLQVGMSVVGAGVPVGAFITAIVYGADGRTPTTATLSANTTAALTTAVPLVCITTTSFINSSTLATTDSDNFRSNFNSGFALRQTWLNNTSSPNMVANPAITAVSSNQTQLLVSGGSYSQIFMAYVQKASGTRAIIFDAVVRLKDIADFFQKVPLLKGSTMRLYINTNQTYFTCGVVSAQITGTKGTNVGSQVSQLNSGVISLTSSPIILGGGNTCPVMVASNDIGQGSYNLAPATSVIPAAPVSVRYGLSIVKTQFSQFTNQYTAPVTSVRLYAPAYTMSPLSEQRYLSLASTKKVVYNDIFYYSFPSIGAGSTFSFLVSNGLPNIRSVLCVPLLPRASQGTASTYATATALAGTTSNSLLSPFSITGGAPDPIAISNFQIQISGKNLFINNLQYDFENFAEQFVQGNALNGSLTTGLSSGLIGFEEWTTTYRYYYGNASRSIPSEDGVAKAVQVSGLNQSGVVIDMMVFIEFQREITLDVRTGARVA
jgi:hypothetical protein